MVELHVDLGQLFIMGMIGLVGFFAKRELNSITKRLEDHDKLIRQTVIKVGIILGIKKHTDLELEGDE